MTTWHALHADLSCILLYIIIDYTRVPLVFSMATHYTTERATADLQGILDLYVKLAPI